MPVPLHVNLRSMLKRRTSTLLTVVGVGLVIMIFVLVASLQSGLTAVLRATGDPAQVVVLRAAARSELESWISRDHVAILGTYPEVDRSGTGEPLMAAEAFTVINQIRRGSDGESANVIVRGVQIASFTMRPEVRLVDGRIFYPGVAELMASRAMAERFEGCGLGETVRLRGRDFKVVGIFEAGRTAWDSEIWADADVLSDTFNRRGGYSSVLLRVSDGAAQRRLREKVEGDRRFSYKVLNQVDYFEQQTSSAATLKVLAWILTVVLSIGACFSAANTMYAAVSHRTREIGTLRALGFSRGSILTAYLVESLALSLLAGIVGVILAGLALAFFTGYTGTQNRDTFAEIAFSFRLTPAIATTGLLLSAVMGVLGGILPARFASRIPIIQALRQI